MTTEGFARIVSTKEEAYEAVKIAYVHAKAVILNGGPARIACEQHEDDRSLAQNRWYWGVCLREIAEQARIEGQRYTAEAFHELFKRMFLGYEHKKVRVAGRKAPINIRKLKSTTRLKVKPMSVYLEKVTAFAVTDLAVRFSVSQEEHRG